MRKKGNKEAILDGDSQDETPDNENYSGKYLPYDENDQGMEETDIGEGYTARMPKHWTKLSVLSKRRIEGD